MGLISLLLTFLIKNVNAAVQNTWFKVNDSLLLPNNYLGASAGNQNFSVNYDGYPDNLLNPTSPWFVSVVLCVDNAGTSIYSNNTAVTDINVNVTNFKCYYPGSSYLGGKVTILNYKNAGGGSYNNTKFTWYLNDYSSFALIDFKISLDSWVVAQNYANITSIVNQQEFINQNNEILNTDISDNDKHLPSKGSFEDFKSAEKKLTDKVKEADTSVLSIGIDSTSSSWVWDTLTSLIKSNTIIFGMFIAILSIGVIKLGLGR